MKKALPHMLFVLVPIVVLVAIALTLRIDPAEDAHIMFRYATNIANGHGIVWNVGEKPVEGATEFLWTITLALGILAGFPVGPFAQIVALVCSASVIVALYYAMVSLLRVRQTVAAAACTLLAASPIVVQGLSGFGAPMFTLFLTIAFVATLLLENERRITLGLWLLPLSLLLASLTRPEGVIFSLLVFSSVVTLYRRHTVRILRFFFWLYCLPGAIYFVWRWQYFGWLLPNTFYAKHGDSLFHSSGIEPTFRFLWLIFPLLIAVIASLFFSKKKESARALLLLAPSFLFPWFYLLIEQMQNIGMRFQFPVLPVFIALAAVAIERLLQREWRFDQRQILNFVLIVWIVGFFVWLAPTLGGALFKTTALKSTALALVIFVIVFSYPSLFRSFDGERRKNMQHAFAILLLLFLSIDLWTVTTYKTRSQYDHRAVIGKALLPFAEKKYSVVTTEAGWLPFFSGWRAVDPFGLYDEHIAHHGLDDAYLDVISPELIVFHVYSDSHSPKWVHGDDAWNAMTQKLYAYAQRHQYILAARVGVHHDCNWYFVKRSSPDAIEIARIISTQKDIPYTTPVN